MTGTYDWRLVALSIVIAVLASYTALDLAGRVTAARARARAAWLGAGAVAMGVGIWSMHFVGMLAFRLPVPMAYDVASLGLSALVAIVASALALHVVSRDRVGLASVAAGGLLMGPAIAGMHYIGMGGLRVPAQLAWHRPTVAASVAVAVAAAVAALWLAFHFREDPARPSGPGVDRRRVPPRAGGAVVMGAAIAGMHYTGMAAARFSPPTAGAGVAGDQVLATGGLAAAVVASTVCVLAVALAAAAADRWFAARTAVAGEARESEERLRAYYSALSVGVVVQSAAGHVLYANEAAERFLGVDVARVRGRPSSNPLLVDLWREDGTLDAPDTHPVAIARRTGVPVRGMLRAVRTDAPAAELLRGERWLLVDAVPLDRDGKLLVTFTDITERRRLLVQARESDARSSAIVEAALDPIVVINAGGIVTEFNPAAERVFGYRRDEAIGRDMADLIVPPAHRAAHRAGRERYLATGEAHVIGRRIEVPAMRADGSEFPVELIITRLPGGDAPRFAGFMRDLTERRRLEESLRFLADASAALAESLEYEGTLARVARLAVPGFADWCAVDLLLEDDGGQRLERLAVAHADAAKVALVREVQARYPADLDAPRGAPHVVRTGRAEMVAEIDDALLVRAARDEEHLRFLRGLGLRSYIVAPLLAGERAIGAVTFAQAESGRQFTEADLALAGDLARRMAVAIENARLYREVAEARDQLEHQATQLEAQALEMEESQEELEVINQELQSTNDELLRKTDEAERARVAADEANRAKSEFLAMMSHELRTPLNAIGGYAQLLEMGVRGPVTEAQREDLRRIQRSQAHLARLVSDVLNFAKLEAGQVDFHLTDVPVDALLSGMDAMVRPQLDAKRLTYEFRGGDPAVTARADRDRLQQVVLNLLTNAVKFTEPGGRVVLDWTADARCVRICVSDTGIGIAPEKLPAIFEPFVQVDRQLTVGTEGIGLGLAISRDIALAMGGEIEARSAPGEGSTFTVTVPRGRPLRDPDAERRGAAAPADG